MGGVGCVIIGMIVVSKVFICVLSCVNISCIMSLMKCWKLPSILSICLSCCWVIFTNCWLYFLVINQSKFSCPLSVLVSVKVVSVAAVFCLAIAMFISWIQWLSSLGPQNLIELIAALIS